MVSMIALRSYRPRRSNSDRIRTRTNHSSQRTPFTTDPRAQATILVREAMQLYDLLGRQLSRDTEGCVANEVGELSEQANAWQALYGPNRKLESTSAI